MEYVVLGKTGQKVSRIGFGGATAGLKNYLGYYDPRNPVDRGRLVATIRKAYESGVNYFDTAASYGNGESEEIYGVGLRGIPEDEIFLATKILFCDGPGARQALEASLKRLGRDRIDLIQIHGSMYTKEQYDSIMGRGGMLKALEKAKAEGLVRFIGFSDECQNEPLYGFIRSGRFDVMQIEYNLLFQHPCDPSFRCGSMYDAEERGLGIVAMRTVTSGIFQKWIRMVDPANTFDYNRALIQFVLSNPLVDVALIGMRNEKELADNIGACNDLSGRIALDEMHRRYLR